MTIDSAYQYGSYYQNYRSEIKQVSVDEVRQQDKQQLQAAQEDISTLQQEYRQRAMDILEQFVKSKGTVTTF